MKFNIPPITIQQMIIFVTVVEANGFANASRSLMMTQSAVSKAVAKLEKELSIKLFYRSTRFLELTEAGKILYEDMKLNLLSLQNSYNHALKTTEENNSMIRIGLMNTARPERYFYPVMTSFSESHPEIQYEVESQYMTDLPAAVESGHFDLVILPDFTRFYLESRKLRWRYFTVDTAQLLMSSKHPLAGKKTLTTKDMAGQKFVAVSTFTLDQEYLKDLSLRLSPYDSKPEVSYIYKTAHDIRYLFRAEDAVLFVDSFFDYPLDANDFVILPVTDQKNGTICAWDPHNNNKALNIFLSELPDIPFDPETGFPLL